MYSSFRSIFLPLKNSFPCRIFFLQRAYGVPFFFIPRFVRKRERDRKSAYYFSVDLCKRRTASVLLFILCNAKILCKNRRLYSFAEWNRNFNFEKNYCRFIVSMYLIDHSMKKRYSWIKAHEQRPDVDNRIGLIQVSSYKEYTRFTIECESNFFFLRI